MIADNHNLYNITQLVGISTAAALDLRHFSNSDTSTARECNHQTCWQCP